MPTGVTRILPFAVISAALHAAVLMNAPERLEIAVTPGGDTGPVAVRLVPFGPTALDPAAQSGVVGSTPAPTRDRHNRTEPATKAAEASTGDESGTGETSASPGSEVTEQDHAEAASSERITTEVAATDTDRKRVDTAASRTKDVADESTTTTDVAEESTRSVAAATDRTADSPDTPEMQDAPKTAESTDPAQIEDSNPNDAAGKTAEAIDQRPRADSSDTAAGHNQAQQQSGADGSGERAQLAGQARQQVEIHFRDRFRYPRIARQRGWEGRVVLTFRLQPDGRITDVQVTESSGRSILDQNARQTLIHIQRVPEIADRLQGQALELEVPVTYRLQPA